MKSRFYLASASIALALGSTSASAAVFVVNAFTHSANNGSGTPLNTGIALTAGQFLSVASSTNDLWSAGALPRFSDANGLTANRFANASDDSGQAVGTLIGQDFGLVTLNGYTAPYGTLVGRIGGVYQQLGANYAGTAWNTGALELFYWDTNTGDNAGEIAFDVNSAIPEPTTWMMMLAGFGIAGYALRLRRRRTSHLASFV